MPKKKKELLPAKKESAVTITKENLTKLLTEGLITVKDAGKFLALKKEQIEFAERYMQYSGDGLACAADIFGYNVSTRQGYIRAKQEAERLLNNPDVVRLISDGLHSRGLRDVDMDNLLKSLAYQAVDKKVQLAAIKEWNELTGRLRRIEEEKNKQVFDWTKLTDTQLQTMIELMETARIDGIESNIPTVETTTLEVDLSADAEIIQPV